MATGPASAWTNCGKKARKNSATLGLVMPTTKASAKARRELTGGGAAPAGTGRGAELAHREVDEVGDPGVLDDRERDDGRGRSGRSGRRRSARRRRRSPRSPQRRGQCRAAALGDAAADDVEQVGPGSRTRAAAARGGEQRWCRRHQGLRSLIVPFRVPPVAPGPGGSERFRAAVPPIGWPGDRHQAPARGPRPGARLAACPWRGRGGRRRDPRSRRAPPLLPHRVRAPAGRAKSMGKQVAQAQGEAKQALLAQTGGHGQVAAGGRRRGGAAARHARAPHRQRHRGRRPGRR